MRLRRTLLALSAAVGLALGAGATAQAITYGSPDGNAHPATGGLVQAHVIRMTKPFEEGEVSTPHYHDVDFQMVYVLKGWFSSEFEGEGVHTFSAGSCWIQPPKIKHTVRGYSDDCELLEIVLPADFETVTLA